MLIGSTVAVTGNAVLMIIKCPHCNKESDFDYAGKEGKIVRMICKKCNNIFKYQIIGGKK